MNSEMIPVLSRQRFTSYQHAGKLLSKHEMYWRRMLRIMRHNGASIQAIQVMKNEVERRRRKEKHAGTSDIG